MINKEKIMHRIKKGNELAEYVAKYLNHRYGYNFKKVGLQEDKESMIDYRCDKYNKTAQFKCRDNQSDIIYECWKFIPRENNQFENVPGRDVRTKADFYICLNSSKTKIIVAETSKIKEIAKNSINEKTIESVANIYKEAKLKPTKSKFLKSNSNLSEVCFKIDEGKDTNEYGKILIFIPFDSIKEAKVIDLKPKENILDERSWN